MDIEPSGSPQEEWSLYANPAIFRVAASGSEDGWIHVTMEVRPGDVHSRRHDPDDEPASVSLQLKLEEIPRLIAILNEIYRHHVEAVAALEFEPDFEFPRREPLPGGQTLTWPVASRLEPESDPEDWKDRRARLSAFKVVADSLADDFEKLGLLRPIG
jgi:hypothetical protein